MPHATGTPAERSIIASRSEELRAAVNGADVERVLDVWADDGVMMPPGAASVRGRAALDRYFRNLFASTRITFVFTSSDVEIEGDIAAERLTYTATARPIGGGAATESAGKGLHLYRRGQDGVWRLTIDIWNSDSA